MTWTNENSDFHVWTWALVVAPRRKGRKGHCLLHATFFFFSSFVLNHNHELSPFSLFLWKEVHSVDEIPSPFSVIETWGCGRRTHKDSVHNHIRAAISTWTPAYTLFLRHPVWQSTDHHTHLGELRGLLLLMCRCRRSPLSILLPYQWDKGSLCRITN